MSLLPSLRYMPALPSPHNGELIQVRAGIVSVNGEPVLRFASTPQAGIFLSRLGFRASENAGVWTFWKPQPKKAA